MKKILICLTLFLSFNSVFATENPHNAVYNGDQVFHSNYDSKWSLIDVNTNDKLVLTKELFDGTGSCSTYKNIDNSLAFALSTDFEIIKNGNLIVVDNNLLKYSKIIYNGETFELMPLCDEEIKQAFPDAEIYKMSWIDNDNKMWLHKPLLKKRKLLLVNDTDNFYHQFSCKYKNVQDPEIKGLITINRYGIFRFKHFGKRNGELTFYVR